MVVTAAAMTVFVMMVLMVVVTAAAMAVFVMMVVLLAQFGKVSLHRSAALHSFQQLPAGELIPGRGNNGCNAITLPKHFHRSIQLILGNEVCTG